MRVAVLGGGISGCAVAAELARGGAEVTLVERAARLGGLHRSLDAGGHVFDIGAFIFEEGHAIFEIFPELREDFPEVDNHYGSVRAGAFLDDYPLSPRGLRQQFGSLFVARCIVETIGCKLLYRRRDSVPRWVKYYIGPSLYERSGLRRYIERLYLSPHDEIGLEFAEKRMGVLAESASIRLNLRNVAARLVRGRSIRGVVRPLTAPVIRVRPASGFQDVYTRIGSILSDLGVKTRLEETVRRVRRHGDGFELTGLKGETRFDHLLSTIPLEILAGLIGLRDFVTPEYVDVYSLFYELPGPVDFPYNVLHNFTDHGQWKRMTVFSKYYGASAGKHFFTVEGTARADGDPQTLLDEAVRDFERWLSRVPIFEESPAFIDGVLTPHAYPVYRTDTAQAIADLKRRVEDHGVVLSGRQGTFNYISSSDAAADARSVTSAFLRSTRGAAARRPGIGVSREPSLHDQERFPP